LLENAKELEIRRVRPDTMNDRKGELSLSEILAKPFLMGVSYREKVYIVVTNLINDSEEIHEWNKISTPPQTLVNGNEHGNIGPHTCR
jgi:hypothetical protein